MIVRRPIFLLAISLCLAVVDAHAQVDPKLYSDMKWREIGPDARRPHARSGRCTERAGHLLSRCGERRACGRRPTPARRGTACGTTSRAGRLGRLPCRRAIRTSSTWPAAKACSGPISRPATVSTNPPMRARRGRTSKDCVTASRSARSRSTRRTRTGSSWRSPATRTARTKSAACTGRSTAARPSSAFCLQTTAPARPRCRSIRSIPTSSSRACGSGRRLRGRTDRSSAQRAGSTARPTAATPGPSSPEAACRTTSCRCK